jgi:hypothetical protein
VGDYHTHDYANEHHQHDQYAEEDHRHTALLRELDRLEGLVRGQAQRIDHLASRLVHLEKATGHDDTDVPV